MQFGIDPRGEKYFWIGPKRVEDKLRKGSDLDAINNYEYYRTYTPQMSFAPYPFDKVGRAIIKNEQGEYYLIDLYGNKY